MKNIDYHAKLVIHGLPTMSKKELSRLNNWLLDNVQEEIEQILDGNISQKDFAKVYTKRLMK